MTKKDLINEIETIAKNEIYLGDFNLWRENKEVLTEIKTACELSKSEIETLFSKYADIYPNIAERISTYYLTSAYWRRDVLIVAGA